MSLFIFPNSLPSSLVTRQSTRKDEFKCHLDISQVENCLLLIFDLNDPHGTHLLSFKIAMLPFCPIYQADAHSHSFSMAPRHADPRRRSKEIPRNWNAYTMAGRTRREKKLQRIGKKVRLVRHGVGSTIDHRFFPTFTIT